MLTLTVDFEPVAKGAVARRLTVSRHMLDNWRVKLTTPNHPDHRPLIDAVFTAQEMKALNDLVLLLKGMAFNGEVDNAG